MVYVFSTFLHVTQAYAGISEDNHNGVGYGKASPSGLPQLDPSSFESQAFWLILVFVCIYLFFSKKSLPEISKVIENRDERIKNDLDSASVLKEEVESLQQSYESSLKATREQSAALFKDAENFVKIKAEDKSKDFHEYSCKKISELEDSIEKARIAVMEEMSHIAAGVAIEAAEKIIGIRADEESVRNVAVSLSKAA